MKPLALLVCLALLLTAALGLRQVESAHKMCVQGCWKYPFSYKTVSCIKCCKAHSPSVMAAVPEHCLNIMTR